MNNDTSGVAPLHRPTMHKSTKKRRRQEVTSCCLLLVAATAALSCLTSVVNPNPRTMMVAQALSIPPLRLLVAPRPVHHLYIDSNSCDHCTRLLSFKRNIDVSASRLEIETTQSTTARPSSYDTSKGRHRNSKKYGGEISPPSLHDTSSGSFNSNKSNNNNGSHQTSNSENNTNDNHNYKKHNNRDKQSKSWLDRTTAQVLDPPSSSTPSEQLTPDDVSLITTLMTSHARRSTVDSALICEQLLKRVVEEVNDGNSEVRVTTKMYTVAMDACAKAQRRPLPGSGTSLNGHGSVTNDGNPKSKNGSRKRDRPALKGRITLNGNALRRPRRMS